MRETGLRGVYSTLNYELLLEICLAEAGFRPMYVGEADQKDDALVLKLHGSCNFLPALRPPYYPKVRFQNVEWKNWVGEQLVSGPVRPEGRNETIQFYRGKDSRGPAMAMYMPGKRSLFSHEFIVEQQRRWQAEVRNATRIFVIGCRLVASDEHIWGPLATAEGSLFYVGREPDEFSSWAADRRRRQAEVLAHTFADAVEEIRLLLRRA